MSVKSHGAEVLKKAAEQVVSGSDAEHYLKTSNINSLVSDKHDYIALTYVAAGNGAGEIETVIYKTGGAGGTTVATLTLTYDANDELETVTKS